MKKNTCNHFQQLIKLFKTDLLIGVLIVIVLFVLAVFLPTETVGSWINELLMGKWIYGLISFWFISALILPWISSTKLTATNKYLGIFLIGAAIAALAANLFVFVWTNIIVISDVNSRKLLGGINFCITSTNLLQIFLITISLMGSKYILTQEWTPKKKTIFTLLAISIFGLHFFLFGLCKN